MSLPPAEIQYQKLHYTDDRRSDIIISDAVCLSVAVVTVGLRFLARALIKAPVRVDSWLILVATFFTAAFTVCNLVLIHYGLGRHLILSPDVVTFAKVGLLTEALYTPSIMFTKLSILFLYQRLFPGKIFVRILWALGLFVLGYSIARIFVDVLQCVPIEADWNPLLPGAKCVNLTAELITFSSLNTVTDIIILILPIPMLWQLKIKMTQKLQLIGIFMLGGLVCVMSVVRAITLVKISHLDATWSDVDSCIWSTVETCVAIICANLPCLRPLHNYIMHGKAQLSGRSTGYDYQVSSNRGDNSALGREPFRRMRSVTESNTGLATTDDEFNFNLKEIEIERGEGGDRGREESKMRLPIESKTPVEPKSEV